MSYCTFNHFLNSHRIKNTICFQRGGKHAKVRGFHLQGAAPVLRLRQFSNTSEKMLRYTTFDRNALQIGELY